MKQLHVSEIQKISQELNAFLDARAQKIFASETGIGLELWKNHETVFLWFELNPTGPFILLFKTLPRALKLVKNSPVLLFGRAHLEGKRLSEIIHKEEYGRLLELHFGYEDPLKVEIRLFPHGTNVIIHSGDKKISFDKIKEIKEASVVTDPVELRSLSQVTEEWLKEKESKTKHQEDPESRKQKEIQKKQNTLQKMTDHLAQLQDDIWARLGEWLKENQTLKVPEEYKKLVDTKKSFAQNIQICFQRAKKNQEKLEGTLQRIEILKKEISDLESKDFQFIKKENTKNKKDDGWRGYRFALNDKAEVFVGKNAQENMHILKFAQSWDYWMHIKDYPGAHGIIRRPRGLAISDYEFREVAQFIASKSKKSAHFLGPGEGFDVLIVECRHVKPIKGDKLGRVTYSNERVLLCRMPLK